MESIAVRPIKSEEDYLRALARIDELVDAEPGTSQAEYLEVLSILVADYEDRHHAIEPPDPVAFLAYVLESRGYTRKDLEPFIGSRARVAEIMNRRRPLTMDMVRRLSKGLDLPADVLIQPYVTQSHDRPRYRRQSDARALA